MQAHHPAPVRGPAFIRQISRLADRGIPAPGLSLSAQLGQWIDWTRAVALSRALDGRPPATTDAPAIDADACIAARNRLTDSIVAGPATPPAAGDDPFAPFRQHCLAQQRAMQAATGRLRGQLRERLAAASPDMARLAEVDAAMELALAPQEQALLGKLPPLLGRHFEALQQAADTARSDPQASLIAGTTPSDSWLETFLHAMRDALLAELDLRFQPIEALLAALRTC